MKQLNTIEEIEQIKAPALIKFGQPGCVPCQITEENLVGLEQDYKDIPMYSCSNLDVVISMGLQHTPFIKALTNDGDKSLSDVDTMMDSSELNNWISTTFNKN